MITISEAPLSVTGLGEWDISVESSEGAVLPCRASVLLGSVSVTWNVLHCGKESQDLFIWLAPVLGALTVI